MNEQISILLDFRYNRIRINLASLRKLGEPTNIMLLVNPESRHICIKAGDPNDPTTHRIASQRQIKNNYYELHSKHLMGILLQCGDWDSDKNYRLSGKVKETDQGRMILYSIDSSVCVTISEMKQETENKQ